MTEMEAIIRAAFPCAAQDWGISETFIESHPCPLEQLADSDPMIFVPAYMVWCLRNQDRYDQVITDHTIDALAVYGRSSVATPLGSFKSQCSVEQRAAIAAFLQWCAQGLTGAPEEQIERSRKRWLPNG